MALDFDTLVLAPNHAVFGETFTYAPAGGAPFDLSVIFDEAFMQVTWQDGAPTSSVKPVGGVRLSTFPPGTAPAQGDQLQRRKTGVLYNVTDIDQDGQGAAKLVLMVAA